MRFTIVLLLMVLSCVPVLAELPPAADARTRCAVCGMFVAPYPHWVAVAVLEDGRNFYFDGPKDLFIFYADMARYLPGTSPEQVQSLFVTEYYTTRLLPATEVFFVTGSNVWGPMGAELVPVAGREAAETFRRDHAGAKLMRFDGRELQEVVETQ